MNILNIENLRKNFASGDENLEILKDLSFVLPEQRTLIITGESGSGKSTLLNCIAGLEPVSSGKILCSGWKVTELSEHWLSEYRKQTIGFIFQFHYLLEDFTALENVMLPAYMAGEKKKSAQDRARSLLSEVNLAKRGHHYPSELSGGERQRVAVARAFVNEPVLILADEPTGNLDEYNSGIVEEILFSLVQRHGKTMILVTHDREIAKRGDLHKHLETGVLCSV